MEPQLQDAKASGSPPASVGIVSIGEMGLGIAKLLKTHGYRVLTNISGRSERTHTRASAAAIELVDSDTALVEQADYVLSIVPPKDAFVTAQRIADAVRGSNAPRAHPLYFLDLNAVSPALAREIGRLFEPLEKDVRLIDGGILGNPPSRPDPSTAWQCPSIPLSGPHALSDAPQAGAALASLLNTRHLNGAVGAASGLKMCFAALHKGFAALAVQSFTTAQRLGVLSDLQQALDAQGSAAAKMAKGLPSMPPKAYRWIAEMHEISRTFAADGGFGADEDVFAAIGGVYRAVSEDTVLGKEITENRKRGRTIEDVAECVAEGLEQRKTRKTS